MQCLDENQHLIAAILENQNAHKLADCLRCVMPPVFSHIGQVTAHTAAKPRIFICNCRLSSVYSPAELPTAAGRCISTFELGSCTSASPDPGDAWPTADAESAQHTACSLALSTAYPADARLCTSCTRCPRASGSSAAFSYASTLPLYCRVCRACTRDASSPIRLDGPPSDDPYSADDHQQRSRTACARLSRVLAARRS